MKIRWFSSSARLWAGLWIAVLVAGCSLLATSGTVNSKPSVSPLVLATPSGPVLNLEEAATRYLTIVRPHNQAANEWYAVEDANGSWQEQQQATAKLFEVDDIEIQDLAGTAWPSDIRPLVDRLVQVKIANRQAMSDAVHASTEAEFFRPIDIAFAPAGMRRGERRPGRARVGTRRW